jgi:hypothetical protein
MARFFVLAIDELQDDEMCFRKIAENLVVLGSPRLLLSNNSNIHTTRKYLSWLIMHKDQRQGKACTSARPQARGSA